MDILNYLTGQMSSTLSRDQKTTRYAMLLIAIWNGVKLLKENYKSELEIICGDEDFKQRVINNCPSLLEGAFYPTLYLPTSTF